MQSTGIFFRKCLRSLVAASPRWPRWFLAIAVPMVLGCRSEAPTQPEVPMVADAEGPRVEIDSEVDPSFHEYEWIVTNRHTSPIVCIEFPHWNADLFPAPPGWQVEVTGLVGQQQPGKGQMCIARAEPPNSGISQGAAQRFTMRIAPRGAPMGQGKVTVRFADGKAVAVPGVSLPVRPPSDRNLSLLGAAIIFGLWVVIRTIRERRRARQRADVTTEGHGDQPERES